MNQFSSFLNWFFQSRKIFFLFASSFFIWQINLVAKPIKVVTSFYPLEFLVSKIAPEIILENLTDTDPHKFYPSAKSIIAINEADLFIYITDSLEVWAKALALQRKKRSISIQKQLPALFFRTKLSDRHQEKITDFESLDPHIWLDPVIMSKVTSLLAKEIIKLDKTKQELYLKRAKDLQNIFLQIHRQYQNSLTNCKQNAVIVSHDFIGYLSRRYKFKTYSMSGVTTLDQPSVRSILEFKKLAKQEVDFILIDKNIPSKFANILLNETSVEFLIIDNLTSKAENYLARMQKNLYQLKTSLVCN